MRQRTLTGTEFEHQKTVVEWAKLVGKYFKPELNALHAIPNAGKRNPAQAKGEGICAGVPDLHLPVPRKGFASLYIEMKRLGGKVSDCQRAWHELLQRHGNKVSVCYSADEAIKELQEYLG